MSVEVVRDDDEDRTPAAEWEEFFDALCAIDQVLKNAGLDRSLIPASEAADLALDLRQAVRRLLDLGFAKEADKEMYR